MAVIDGADLSERSAEELRAWAWGLEHARDMLRKQLGPRDDDVVTLDSRMAAAARKIQRLAAKKGAK